MSETITSEEKAAVKEFCASVWWLVLLRGIAVLILGGMLIAKPGLTAVVLVQFLGAYFLVDGVFSIINSIMGRKYMAGWGWGLLMGALEILTGIVIFAHPLASTLFTASFLAYMVAFSAILFGILGIITGIQVRKEVKGEWAMIAGGVLAIIVGILLIIKPTESATIYLIIMGVMAIIGGLVQIFASFQIRRVGKVGLKESDLA